MKIAIVGAGGIGSTFAVQLAQAGHDVVLVARGKRLAQLESAGGVATAAGPLVRITPAATLDETVRWDLVLVTVLAFQVDALLPALVASKAAVVMFMFNTFEPVERLRTAVGAERFAFGFPSILAQVDEDGVLHASIQTRGMATTVSDAHWARVFGEVGIPSVLSDDMTGWLRAHAAAIVPFMLAAASSHANGRGIGWSEARALAAAMKEGFRLVTFLGHALVPAPVAVLGRLPEPAIASLLWIGSRTKAVRDSGAAGTREPAALIAAMRAASPTPLPAIERVQPG